MTEGYAQTSPPGASKRGPGTSPGPARRNSPPPAASGYRKPSDPAHPQEATVLADAAGKPDERVTLAPVGLEIPAIGVRTDVVPMGPRPEGGLDAFLGDIPVAWHREPPGPGETGSSVIVGHVERLRLLRPGDEIRVRRADGGEVRFAVTRVGLYPENAFPAQPGPELTLITPGTYSENLVVFAERLPPD